MRGFIMLAGLVAVPLAAIFGSSLPELVRDLADQPDDIDPSVVWNTSPGSSRTEAPKFRDQGDVVEGRGSRVEGEARTQVVEGRGSRVEGQARTQTGLPTLSPQPSTLDRFATLNPQPSTLDQSGPERFTWMERRLRDLGATYYLLEAWGNDGGLFRFHCKMAIAGNAQLNRHFEATDPDPLRAMERVLTQVEAWKSEGRRVK
jgi:hypothetical protein